MKRFEKYKTGDTTWQIWEIGRFTISIHKNTRDLGVSQGKLGNGYKFIGKICPATEKDLIEVLTLFEKFE